MVVVVDSVVVVVVVDSDVVVVSSEVHRLVVVIGEHHDADHDGHDGRRRPKAEQQALAVVGTLGIHELLLDSGQGVGRRLDVGRTGFHGLAQTVLRGHRRSSSRSASVARPRWAWVLTDPAEMPSVSAISASERSR